MKNFFLIFLLVADITYANMLDKELEEFSITGDSPVEIIMEEDFDESLPQDEGEENLDSITKFNDNFHHFALIRLTNKITATTNLIKLKKGSYFTANNHLQIKLEYCWTAPPYKDPENKAFLRVLEIFPNGKKQSVFDGWLFSSSPSVSSMEHPIYDILLVRCSDN